MQALDDISNAAQAAPGTARVGAQSAVDAERAAVLAGDYAHDVQVGMRTVPHPQGLVGPNGQPLTSQVPVMARQVKPSIPVSQARAGALASAKFDPKNWGGHQGPGEPSKAVELASRNAVKDALPATQEPLGNAAAAIPARDALRIMHWRDANRDMMSLPASAGNIAAAATGHAGPLEVGFLMQALKNNQLRLGIYARDIRKMLENGDVMNAARLMQKLGVNLASQAADVPREGSMTIGSKP
jgi:hypothetical protein